MTQTQDRPRIYRQRMLVEMASGECHLVTPGTPARAAWDLARGKRGWPKAQDAPDLSQAFLAWHYLKNNSGIYKDQFDKFLEQDLGALSPADENGDPLLTEENVKKLSGPLGDKLFGGDPLQADLEANPGAYGLEAVDPTSPGQPSDSD